MGQIVFLCNQFDFCNNFFVLAFLFLGKWLILGFMEFFYCVKPQFMVCHYNCGGLIFLAGIRFTCPTWLTYKNKEVILRRFWDFRIFILLDWRTLFPSCYLKVLFEFFVFICMYFTGQSIWLVQPASPFDPFR